MNAIVNLSRRNFLKASALAGGGLIKWAKGLTRASR